MPSLRFSLREHDIYHPDHNPDVRFNKNGGASKIRVDSYLGTLTPMGRGYCFIAVPRAWLNGKYVRFNWQGYFSYSGAWFTDVPIYDGGYVRSSDTDFPFGSDLPTKGAGLLQTLATKTATFSAETVDTLIDVSAGTEDRCTLFFRIRDAWAAQNCYIDVDWVEFNTGSGGSGNLYSETFTDNVTMEVTGTHGDYGYISTGVVPAALSVTVTDILGMVDSVAKPASFKKTVSDVLGMSDSVSKPVGFKKTVAEILGMSDVVGTKAAFKRSVSEVLGMLDSVDRVRGVHVTVAEILGVRDRVETRKHVSKIGDLPDHTITGGA